MTPWPEREGGLTIYKCMYTGTCQSRGSYFQNVWNKGVPRGSSQMIRERISDGIPVWKGFMSVCKGVVTFF